MWNVSSNVNGPSASSGTSLSLMGAWPGPGARIQYDQTARKVEFGTQGDLHALRLRMMQML